MKFWVDKREQYTDLGLAETRLDGHISSSLKSELVVLNAEGHKNLIFDLSKVEAIDSQGISALLIANRLCNDSGGLLVLIGVAQAVEHELKLADAIHSLTILNKHEEAVDAIFLHEIEVDLTAGDTTSEA